MIAVVIALFIGALAQRTVSEERQASDPVAATVVPA